MVLYYPMLSVLVIVVNSGVVKNAGPEAGGSTVVLSTLMASIGCFAHEAWLKWRALSILHSAVAQCMDPQG